VSDADDSAPAVWDPTARGGAGGWVRRERARAGTPQAAPESAGPGAGDDAPAALLRPWVPGQQPEQPDTVLARPPLPSPADSVRQDRPRPPRTPGYGASPEPEPESEPEPELVQGPEPVQWQKHGQEHGDEPLRPAGYVRPPYTRPSPGQPTAVPEVPAAPAAAARRRVRPALLAVVVAVAVVGLIGVLTLGGSGKPHDAGAPVGGVAGAPASADGSAAASVAPPGSGSSGGGSAGTGPSQATGNGKSQATAVDQLLGESSESDFDQQTIDAVAQVTQCDPASSVTAAQTTLTRTATAEQALVTRLNALNVSQVQGGAQAVQMLSQAWSDSASADTAYARWAGTMAHGGCTQDNAPQNADYADAGTQSGQASTDKNTFIDLWTPIAMQYGLPTRTADDI
jgi:hypothetical protein